MTISTPPVRSTSNCAKRSPVTYENIISIVRKVLAEPQAPEIMASQLTPIRSRIPHAVSGRVSGSPQV